MMPLLSPVLGTVRYRTSFSKSDIHRTKGDLYSYHCSLQHSLQLIHTTLSSPEQNNRVSLCTHILITQISIPSPFLNYASQNKHPTAYMARLNAVRNLIIMLGLSLSIYQTNPTSLANICNASNRLIYLA